MQVDSSSSWSTYPVAATKRRDAPETEVEAVEAATVVPTDSRPTKKRCVHRWPSFLTRAASVACHKLGLVDMATRAGPWRWPMARLAHSERPEHVEVTE